MFEKENDESDIIDDSYLALFPYLPALLHQVFGRLIQILALPMLLHDLNHLAVAQGFPQSVARQHQNRAVVWRETHRVDVRLPGDSDVLRNVIPNGPAHGQPRNVFVLQPHS